MNWGETPPNEQCVYEGGLLQTCQPVPGAQQIILRVITWHIQDKQGIRPSQQGFRKGRMAYLISFHARWPSWWMRGRLWMCLPGIQQSLWHSPMASPGKAVSAQLGEGHSWLGKNWLMAQSVVGMLLHLQPWDQCWEQSCLVPLLMICRRASRLPLANWGWHQVGWERGSALQKDLARLDPWAKISTVRFSRIKCRVLHFSHNNPLQLQVGAEAGNLDMALSALGWVSLVSEVFSSLSDSVISKQLQQKGEMQLYTSTKIPQGIEGKGKSR